MHRLQAHAVLLSARAARLQHVGRMCFSAPADESASTKSDIETLKELFRQSKTCALLPHKHEDIFVIGDMHGCDKAQRRIMDSIRILKPRLILVEEDESHADSKWRRPKFKGKVINDSYMQRYASAYPSLGNQFEKYTKEEEKSHGYFAVQSVKEIDGQIKEAVERRAEAGAGAELPFDPQMSEPFCAVEFARESLAKSLAEKAAAGQLEEMTMQYTETFLREARKRMAKRPRPTPDRPPIGLYGSMEGVDEDEKSDQVQAEYEALRDLDLLTNYWSNTLYNQRQFADKCGAIRNIDDLERIASTDEIRNAVMNLVFRELGIQNENTGKQFWNVMKLIWANRDRTLLRLLRQRLYRLELERDGRVRDEMEKAIVREVKAEGKITAVYTPDDVAKRAQEYRRSSEYDLVPIAPVLAIVNAGHVCGIDTLWRDPEFWYSEQSSFDMYATDLSGLSEKTKVEIEMKLEELKMPFVSRGMEMPTPGAE